MEIKIGIVKNSRELVLETNESVADITQKITEVLDRNELLTLTDTKGRTFLIPSASISYVECGAANARPVGFGSLDG